MVEELENRYNNLKESIGEHNKETLDVLVNLANMHVINKNYDKAFNMLKHALDIQLDLFGENSRDTIHTMDSLGNLFLDKKDYVEAKGYYEKSFKLKEKTYNEKEIKEAKKELDELYKIINN